MEDISLFSTSQTLEELELFSSLPILGESGTLEQYDVYIEETDALKHQLDPSSPLSLSAADLLEEFDVEAGNGGLLDSGWMTEKLEFHNTEPVLSVDGGDLVNLADFEFTSSEPSVSIEPEIVITPEITDSSISEGSSNTNLFANVDEILRKLLTSGKNIVNTVIETEEQVGPTSPLQSVPDVDMGSHPSVLSPESELLEVTTPVASPGEESFSCPSSPETPVKKTVQISPVTTTRAKVNHFEPYLNDKPAKVKTPQQRRRKREQNKDAATRYRVKKREEQDVMAKELAGLEKDNGELKEQVNSLSKEIEYLKNLMLEVYKTKLQKQSLLASN